MKDLLGGLLVLVLVFGGGYCTGKHYEQEAQQAEVDRLNTEARAKEAALEAAVTTTANALRVTNEKAKLAKNSAMLLLTVALSSCASKRPAPYKPPQIPPLPQEVVEEKHQPNLVQKLEKLFSQ